MPHQSFLSHQLLSITKPSLPVLGVSSTHASSVPIFPLPHSIATPEGIKSKMASSESLQASFFQLSLSENSTGSSSNNVTYAGGLLHSQSSLSESKSERDNVECSKNSEDLTTRSGTVRGSLLSEDESKEPANQSKELQLSAKDNNTDRTDTIDHANSDDAMVDEDSVHSTDLGNEGNIKENAESAIDRDTAVKEGDEDSLVSRSGSELPSAARDTALGDSNATEEVPKRSSNNSKIILESAEGAGGNRSRNMKKGQDKSFTTYIGESLFDDRDDDSVDSETDESNIRTENQEFFQRALKSKLPLPPKKIAKALMYERIRLRKMSRQKNSSPPPLAGSTSGSSSSFDEKANITLPEFFDFQTCQPMSTSQEVVEKAKSDDDDFVEVELHSDSDPLMQMDSADSFAFEKTNKENESPLAVPFTPLDYIPYAHGSFSASAPLMIQNQKWMRILRRVLPESHADAVTMLCQQRKNSLFPDAVRIMKWAENNPVVAAFGILNSDAGSKSYQGNSPPPLRSSKLRNPDSRSSTPNLKLKRPTLKARFDPLSRLFKKHGNSEDSSSLSKMFSRNKSLANNKGHIPALEWDVFLDPNLVRNVEKALTVADDARMANDENARAVADAKVDRLMGCLISRVVLAHGSTSQLMAEALGINPKYNFASIVEQGEQQRLYRRRRKSEMPADKPNTRDTGPYLERFEKRMSNLTDSLANDDLVVPFVPGKGKAKAGGMFVERWLECFAKALQLAIEPCSADQNDVSIMFNELEKSGQLQQIQPSMCGVFLCLGYDDPNSIKANHASTSMTESAKEISRLLGTKLRLVLDLKSRRVPPRVWARLVSTFKSRGLHVDGLGSFDIEELRSIGHYVSSPIQQILFFHSAGDLQRAIHANEIRRGDTVYFNAGSLIWTKPKSFVSKLDCCHADNLDSLDGVDDISHDILFHPCAYPGDTQDEIECKATLQDYQRKLDLRIGCYVQEFSISDRTLNAIVKLMNRHSSIYNLGLAWGGVNGSSARGVLGDGYWNQRYMGRHWDVNAEPSDIMQLLHIEDHRLVKKAFRAGAWGPIGMVNPVNDVGGDATGRGARLNFDPCKPVG